MLPKFITSPDPDIYWDSNYITLDFENAHYGKGFPSALEPWASHLLSCWRPPSSTIQSLWGNEYQQQVMLDSIKGATFLVAHNAKFELQWLKRMGADLTKILVWDTMIAEKVLAGNRRWALDLGAVAKRYGFGEKEPYVDACMKGGVCPSDLPPSLLERRCKQDVYQTEQIFLKQRQLLAENNLLPVMFTRCILTPVLADIEFNGIYLDATRVEEEYKIYSDRLNECSRALDKFTGGINPRSTKQKGEFLYDVLKFKELSFRGEPKRTPSGNRLTSTPDILKLKITTKRQREYIALQREFNSLSAAVSKNLEFFHGVCKEREARFQGSFNQTVARTHRLSSSGRKIYFEAFKKEKSCQFQNLPRQFKRLFKARIPGWKIAEVDGAQLEFRVAGFVGNDRQILTDIVNGVDVHQFTADTLTAAGEPTSRQDAKCSTFRPLFGGKSGTTAVQEYCKAFREKYKDTTNSQNKWISDVLATKQLTTCTGLVFYWPTTTLNSRSGYVTNGESICNYPIQSLATADIIPIAITRLWHELKAHKTDTYIVNTIHDSIISELNPKETELYNTLAVKSFTEYVYFYLKQVYNLEFFIPLGVGIKIGDNWSEGEESTYELESPYEFKQDAS